MFTARSGKRMFYKTPVLRMLLDIRKMCVIERTFNVLLDFHVYRALNIRLTCDFKNACFTHVAHFPV